MCLIILEFFRTEQPWAYYNQILQTLHRFAVKVIGELERGVYKGSLQRTQEVLRAMGLRLTIEPVRFPTLDELSDE